MIAGMHPLGKPQDHLQLLTRMGRALGLELSEACARNLISSEDWAKMVQSCRACDVVEPCRGWLALVEREETQEDATIEGCCNAARLLRLLQQQNEEAEQ